MCFNNLKIYIIECIIWTILLKHGATMEILSLTHLAYSDTLSYPHNAYGPFDDATTEFDSTLQACVEFLFVTD